MKRNIKQNRPLFERILILCEGQTEKQYLLSLKNTLPRQQQRGVQIEIESYKRKDPKSLINEATRRKTKARKEGVPYTQLWIVFDHDNLPHREYAFRKARKEKIGIAYTCISIEQWFIWHFENSQSPFSKGDKAKEHLKTHYIRNYRPGKTKVWDFLDEDKTRFATENAKKARKIFQDNIQKETREWDFNPYTTLDQLVNYILYRLNNTVPPKN